jgi:uncharacterized protein YjdB
MRRPVIAVLSAVLSAGACDRAQSGAPAGVSPLVSQDVQVRPASLALRVGQTGSLSVSVPDSSSALPVVWVSSDTAVATVRASGVVVGRGIGTVVVTAAYGSLAGAARVDVSP